MNSIMADSILFDFSHSMMNASSTRYIDQASIPIVAFRPPPRNMLSQYSSPRAAYKASSPSYQDFQPTLSPTNRRSVPSMKELMPLALASPNSPALSPPSTPTFGPTPALRQVSPIPLRPARDHTPIPWLNSSREDHFGHVSPSQFRETPIYSEPNSPELTRAYLTKEDEELSQAMLDYCNFADSEESFFDSDSDSDCDSETSESTAPTSPSSTARYSGSSELSIKCIGENSFVPPQSWLRGPSKAASRASRVEKRTDLDELRRNLEAAFTVPTRPSKKSAVVEKWIDSDSSRCSSPDSFIEVHEAIMTPLTPARPHLIRLTMPSSSAHQQRTSSPPESSSQAKTLRRMTSFGMSLTTPPRTSLLEEPPMPTSPRRRARPAPLHFVSEPIMSKGHKMQATLGSEHMKTTPRYQFSTTEISKDILSLPLAESICDSISGSPRDLQMDTYCIMEIRRLNRLNRASQADFLGTDPFLNQSPVPAHLRVKRSKSIFSLPRIPKRMVTPPPPMPSLRRTTPERPRNDLDLAPFRTIFPQTDDHWRRVLYAHLLAYNHMINLQRQTELQLNTCKASNILGLPVETRLPEFGFNGGSFMEEAVHSVGAKKGGVESILRGLGHCIQGILGCMGGYEIAKRRIQEGHSDQIDWVVVHALAEVVRGLENGVADIVAKTTRVVRRDAHGVL